MIDISSLYCDSCTNYLGSPIFIILAHFTVVGGCADWSTLLAGHGSTLDFWNLFTNLSRNIFTLLSWDLIAHLLRHLLTHFPRNLVTHLAWNLVTLLSGLLARNSSTFLSWDLSTLFPRNLTTLLSLYLVTFLSWHLAKSNSSLDLVWKNYGTEQWCCLLAEVVPDSSLLYANWQWDCWHLLAFLPGHLLTLLPGHWITLLTRNLVTILSVIIKFCLLVQL